MEMKNAGSQEGIQKRQTGVTRCTPDRELGHGRHGTGHYQATPGIIVVASRRIRVMVILLWKGGYQTDDPISVMGEEKPGFGIIVGDEVYRARRWRWLLLRLGIPR